MRLVPPIHLLRVRTARSWLAALVVVVLGGMLTWWLVHQISATIEQTAQARFNDEVRSSTEAVAQRMGTYAEIATYMRSLFLVDPQLDYQQFDRAAQAQQWHTRYPELRNVSFARWVSHSQRDALEQRLRAQGRHEAGTQRPIIHPQVDTSDHYVIEFIWPRERNEGVWGLDIASQPANAAAVRTTQETGQLAVSAPFDLIQESQRPQAIVLRAPVFTPRIHEHTHAAPTTPAPFVGSVAVTIRISEMLDALQAQGFFHGVAMRLQDVGGTHEVQTPNSAPAPAPAPTAAVMGEIGSFGRAQASASYNLPMQRRVLELHGRRWLLSFVATRRMLSSAEEQLPQWLAAGGSLLSLLLATLAFMLVRRNAQAFKQVDWSQQELQRSEERFRAIFNQAAIGVSVVGVQSEKYLRVNRRYCDILGYSAQELLQIGPQDLSDTQEWSTQTPQMQRLQSGELATLHLEKRVRHKDGHWVWVELTTSYVNSPYPSSISIDTQDGIVQKQAQGQAQNCAGQNFYIGVIQDVTQRRRMQEALQTNQERLRTILDHLPVGVLLMQRGEDIVFRNRCFVDITGYSEVHVQNIDQWWQYAYPQPAMRQRIHQHWVQLCQRATQENGVIAAGEYEITRLDGHHRIVNISGVLQGEDHLVIVQDLTQHRAAEEEISYLAYHDPLTDLPNRQHLLALLRQALATSVRQQRCGALFLLDVDHFKTLNEARGHDCGDQLLRHVAERLRTCLHERASAARQGDDEFVIVLEDLAFAPAQAQLQARSEGERILQVLRAPYMLGEEPYHGSVSMGVAVFQGVGDTVQELLKQADMAMYQAKAAGRDQLQFYDPHVRAVVRERAQLVHDMRDALVQERFSLYYQPQVDMAGHIIGCEALLRWSHPQHGFISPATFIPLAEDTGLILPLGQWVLQMACAQLAAWDKDPVLRHMTLAVNVSASQFHEENFVPDVLHALASVGADAHRLELELTESLLLQDVQDTVAKIVHLKGYGVRFSLDDFGTGYSSLAYLKRLPLDQLKIDQSFVRDVLIDPNDAAIARTIVALGTSLGLSVIAEGVESEHQREFLHQAQCHAWQGYLMSKPVPLAQFEALVQQKSLSF